MHEVLVNRLGGLSLPRKSVVRLTDRPDMTLDVYRGRKTTMQQLTVIRNCFYRHYLPMSFVQVFCNDMTSCYVIISLLSGGMLLQTQDKESSLA